ncbi:TetR/AcrR family transcriptional regulator [Rhodococcus gannanensis]|uniref:TetR/AcrR family transcriptional regulator n=1 Tax=Rhodococcus gannanensis TaxID=1960308 RepID=A0ABW4PCS6_9NOCA
MPGTGGHRSTGADGGTRTRILDAAETLIATRGFDGTPTAAIASRAGVPKGLLFYYFPTKESILTALVTERMPTDAAVDLTGVAVSGAPVDSLVNLDAALDRPEGRPVREILWRESSTHPVAHEQLRALRAHLHAITVEVLRASAPLTAPARVLDSCANAWVSAMLTATHLDRYRERGERTASLRAVADVVTAGLGALSQP